MLERLINLFKKRDEAPPARPESVLRRTGALDLAVRARPRPKPVPAAAVPNGKRPRPPAPTAGGKKPVQLADGGPGKNVLVRNKFVREDSGTHETLKILDDSALDTGETTGIDPYNTGRFDRSKNWDKRFRD